MLAPPCAPMSTATAATSTPLVPSSKTVKVVIKGRVQGVCFRDWTVENAQELGLKGWVRNRRDGSVEALFYGDPAKVADMMERRCRVGGPAAAVTAVQPSPSDADPGAVEIGITACLQSEELSRTNAGENGTGNKKKKGFAQFVRSGFGTIEWNSK